MLARRVVDGFGGRVWLEVDDFGTSDLGERFGVDAYPAVFIDRVLVATPHDFWDWGSKQRGRYTPWREAKSREAFVADMRALLERRLSTGSLDRLPAATTDADADGDAASEARLPGLELADLEGVAIDTAALAGRAVVVAFWAPWCPPCRDSLAWLLGLPARAPGVEVLALALQSEEQAVRDAVAEVGRTKARVAMASPDQADAFGGVMAVPTLMVFAPDGRLAATFRGAPDDLHAKVERTLAGLRPADRDAPQTTAFAGREWQLRGQAEVVREPDGSQPAGGREVLRMRSGSARLADTTFTSGRIAFDVRTAGPRSFIGVGFRIHGAGREDVYLRPHNSGRFDAMQYTPVENGVSAWQLIPEHNASLEIPADRWLHVELVVEGARLEVFVDRADEPVLSVDRLRRPVPSGAVALWASFPAGEPADLFPTAFANVSVTPDDRHYAGLQPAAPATDSGLVAAWAVTDAFARPADPETLPTAALAGPWQTAESDEQGRVNLARWVSAPHSPDRDTVLARTVLVADRARTVRLGFGFSDRATVFLRGRPVFRGDNTYRSRSARYLGVMRVDNDVLFLPLEPGENELIFAVTEAFGGWGVTARLLDREGVTVRPPETALAEGGRLAR